MSMGSTEPREPTTQPEPTEPTEPIGGYPIVLLADILDRVVNDAVADALTAAGYRDLTPAQGIVFEMLDPSGSRIADMARRARMTKQGMGQLVTAVEVLGYVSRGPDPSDRRAQVVRMTRRGNRAARTGRDALFALENTWRECLGDDRYEATRQALVELVASTGMSHVR
jgi:DNA-binding MarR family transcriptional regulator